MTKFCYILGYFVIPNRKPSFEPFKGTVRWFRSLRCFDMTSSNLRNPSKHLRSLRHLSIHLSIYPSIYTFLFFPECVGRVPVSLGGLGVRLCSPSFAFAFATVRNRRQPFATVCVTAVRLSTVASASGVVLKTCQVDLL